MTRWDETPRCLADLVVIDVVRRARRVANSLGDGHRDGQGSRARARGGCGGAREGRRSRGPTVGVLGCGIDVMYPRKCKRLRATLPCLADRG